MNESPAGNGEWGFRPIEGRPTDVNPPAFCWRPQPEAKTYQLQCARRESFKKVAYRADEITYNCHTPAKTLAQGRWFWRFRYRDKAGRLSRWSRARSFVIPAGAAEFPMPPRGELLARIPKRHPRLFVRPGQLPHLRSLAAGKLKGAYDELVAECERLLKRPPSTEEPPKYPPGTISHGERWREIWWGNRRRTIKVLNGAATLAFTRLLGGKEEYGRLAKRILMEAAQWDPKGATGYLYNDEAGMPYNYYFSRTYTFVNDLLSEAEKAKCRQVMAIRGREMYEHLYPRHLWRPYGSHRNRAWHFLGEIGIAFLDEIPQAAEWVWFAMNVFYNVYPVWSDADGGWHEGARYWESYVHRFCWWADVMRAAVGIDAFRKPYFSKVGYYPLYLQPPGTVGGGFGDLNARQKSRDNLELMTALAAQSGNGHWQWYVDAHGGPRPEGGYVGFVRGGRPNVQPVRPVDLPSSRCFRGTGQAMLNTNLIDAEKNVEIIFKSSPFGTQSHGYESQNSFLLYAFGRRLLIRSGRRDIYGSKHHKGWMWQTKSTNCITVDGRGQLPHSAAAAGEILAFHTSDSFDFVSGEAARAYDGKLKRFTRSILFVKPELIVIFDRLEAAEPATFQWRLHSPTEMKVNGQEDVRILNGKAACRVSFMHPRRLGLSLTDKFDPPPRPRVKLVEWHLTAQAPAKSNRVAFVTLIRPYRAGRACPTAQKLHRIDGGYALEADLVGGRAVVVLRDADKGKVSFGDISARTDVAAIRWDAQGRVTGKIFVEGKAVRSE